MKLGIMVKVINEDTFKYAAKKGLDFVELCINTENDCEEFIRQLPQIKKWTQTYKVGIASIGRWEAEILDEDGNIDENELYLAYKLIFAASYLGCSNYVCGCNHVDKLSYLENCIKAIEVFYNLIECGKCNRVNISTCNCRNGTFVNTPAAWEIIHGRLKDLGIRYDPSQARDVGGDYVKETVEWGTRFSHVHLKVPLVADGEIVEDSPEVLDQTYWKTFLALLYVKNYYGELSIELYSPTLKGIFGEKDVDYTIAYIKSLLF